jgi:RpiB/LacA/LacB family sugar-phosphate isomerase
MNTPHKKLAISLGSDHGGVDTKDVILEHLRKQGYIVIDRGTHGHDSVDYPNFAKAVSEDVVSKKADLGVLLCTTGIGISIAANKVPGIRAALVYNADTAALSRRHNDANIICMGGKYTSTETGIEWTDIFLTTAFEGGRHQKRIDEIDAMQGSS